DHPKQERLVRLSHADLEATAWHRSASSSPPDFSETPRNSPHRRGVRADLWKERLGLFMFVFGAPAPKTCLGWDKVTYGHRSGNLRFASAVLSQYAGFERRAVETEHAAAG